MFSMRKDFVAFLFFGVLIFATAQVFATTIVLESGQSASYSFGESNTAAPDADYWAHVDHVNSNDQGGNYALGAAAGTMGGKSCLVLQAPTTSMGSTTKTSWWNAGPEYGGGNLATSRDWSALLDGGTISFEIYLETPKDSANNPITLSDIATFKPAFLLWSQHANGFVSSSTDSTLRVGGTRLYADDSSYAYDHLFEYDAWNTVEIEISTTLLPSGVKINGTSSANWYDDPKGAGSFSGVRGFAEENMANAFGNIDCWGFQFEFKSNTLSSVQPINLGIRNVEISTALIPGDANEDGRVDGSDVTILAGNWQTLTGATWGMGDFNKDGKVDGSDVTILAGNWQSGVDATAASVPEPSTLLLLLTAIVSLPLVIRRYARF